MTLSGRTCQAWTSQEPHQHDTTPSELPNKGLGEHSYCRNPDGEDAIWCYTTDPDKRWESCEPLSDISDSEDLTGKGEDYRGR